MLGSICETLSATISHTQSAGLQRLTDVQDTDNSPQQNTMLLTSFEHRYRQRYRLEVCQHSELIKRVLVILANGYHHQLSCANCIIQDMWPTHLQVELEGEMWRQSPKSAQWKTLEKLKPV